ncbi:MAG: hypothetical protein ACI841_000071 [Planctomycetota bacterium]|jgi:hypothetical protein
MWACSRAAVCWPDRCSCSSVQSPLHVVNKDPQVLFLVLLAQTVILIGLTIVVRMRVRRDPKVGKPIRVRLDSAGFKPVLFALEVGLLIVVLTSEDFPTLQAMMTLFGAMLLTGFAPGSEDSAYGERGVFRGWYGRTYEELEEWRLTGEHLRYRLFGEWTSVEVPRPKVAQLRQILQRVAPETESSFQE